MKWIDWAWNTLLVAIVLSLALSIHQARADSLIATESLVYSPISNN